MQPEMLAALGGQDKKGEKDWAKAVKLIAARPDAAKEKCKCHGSTPLRFAASREAPLDVFVRILNAYPDGVKQADNEGGLPLHKAKTADVARLLVEAHPDGVKQADEYGRLPLHVANTADIARLLLEAYPDGAKQFDKSCGNLPLHNAKTADIARLLLEAYPEGVKANDKWGSPPLHFAQTADIAHLLLEAYPHGAATKDKLGKLPLHVAKIADIASLLLEAYPDGVKQADKKGKLPLHHAKTADLSRLLVEAYPDGAKHADQFGKLPLHHAVENNLPDITHLLLEAYPDGVKQADKKGKLPLHHAVEKNLPGIARLLVETYPDGVKQADQFIRLPLHHAKTADLARLLVETYPDGAKHADQSRKLPLHHALKKNFPDVARLLLEAYPDGAKQTSENGWLPLHYAVKANLPDISRMLVEAYPDGVKAAQPVPRGKRDPKLFMLNLATNRNLPDVTRAIISVCPDAAKVADYYGYLPLHLAQTTDVARLLLQAYPDGVKQTNEYGNLPLHYAQTAEIARLLLEAYPEGVKQTDERGRLPLHLPMYQDTFDSLRYFPLSRVKTVDIACLLLEAYPDGVKQADHEGRLPLHDALVKNQPDIACLLLEAYPDAADVTDKEGKLPLQYIVELKYQHQREHLDLCQLAYDATTPSALDHRLLERKGICLASPFKYVKSWAIRLGTRYQRYKIDSVYPLHQSATSVVWFATDVVDDAPVALKLMKNYNEFAREILTRFGDTPVDVCVTKVVGWHVPQGAHPPLEHSMQRENVTEPDFFPEKPYVLVMERGSTSLWHEIGTQRIGGYRPAVATKIFTDAVGKVQALHNVGLIHSDLKPRNFLRMNGMLMLCDMDAALEIGKERTQDMKCSTAYCPPELAKHIFAGGPTIKSIDAAFDVWSLGVILYELCTGQHLFSQDISNDNLVDDNDQTILCAWYTIPDSYLKRVFPGQDAQDAKDLIRWCLKGEPSERPTIKDILAHPFCTGSASTMSLRPMKYHAFLCHAQGDASGTAATLYSLHKALGIHLWYDMRATQLNLDGMKQGVQDSDVIMIVLSRTTLSRWFCRQEILEAVASSRKIQLILEEDPRFNPFDLELWRQAKMVYDCDNKVFHEATPEWSVIAKAIDDHLDDAVPFRRRAYEQDGMMRAICQRCRWKIPMKPTDMDTSKMFTVFVIFITQTIFEELRDGIAGRLPGVRLTADTAELSCAKYVLVVLTKGVIDKRKSLFMQAIEEDKTNRVDRLVFVKKEFIFDGVKQDDAWEFGSHEQKRASDINMAVNAHEALPYRPKVASSSRYRHEYPLMVGELLEKLV